MRKRLFIILFCALVLGLCYFFYRALSVSSDDPPEFALIKNNLTPLECDLNLGACAINFNENEIKFELLPRPIYAMKPFKVKISGLNGLNLGALSLEAYGLNMDMGKIRANLEQINGELVADIVLSACVIDVMRYRFEILNNDKKTGIFIDFDLKI